jgi:hypothetical protein
MASSSLIDFFSGDGSDKQQPVDFLKKFNRAMREARVSSDTALVKAFGDFLKTDSPAEEWYTDQDTPITKPTWENFEVTFKVRFPGMQKAKKSPADLERELANLRLDKKTLGATVAYGGQDAWSHVVFTEKALDLAKCTGIEKTRSSLTGVCDNLPEVFKEKISGNIGTWEAFCTEIKAIDIDALRDWVRKEEVKEKKERERDEANNARFANLEALRTHTTTPASPTAGIRHQMSRTTITVGTNQNNTRSTNLAADPFSTGGGGRGNLFPATNTIARAPSTEVQRAAIRIRISAFPMQPNTPVGISSYRDQCQAWLATFGANQKVTEATGFPLLPGGMPPGSGECYVCRKLGHMRANCTNEQVPFKEKQWRGICGTVLRHGKPTLALVNFIANQEDFIWMQSAGTEDNVQQGNGEGPSA